MFIENYFSLHSFSRNLSFLQTKFYIQILKDKTGKNWDARNFKIFSMLLISYSIKTYFVQLHDCCSFALQQCYVLIRYCVLVISIRVPYHFGGICVESQGIYLILRHLEHSSGKWPKHMGRIMRPYGDCSRKKEEYSYFKWWESRKILVC